MNIKKEKCKIVKNIGIIVLYLAVLITLVVLPLGVEKLIRDGVLGHNFPETIFSGEQWFAFWGSYLGAIITVIVLFATIRYNRAETIRIIKDFECEKQYERLLKDFEDIHNYINLCDNLGNAIDKDVVIYSLKLLGKRYFNLMNECESECNSVGKEYIDLVKQIFYEYLCEAENIPKTLDENEMQVAASKYIKATKSIFSIKHKYINQESILYDETVKKIEESRLMAKRGIYNI